MDHSYVGIPLNQRSAGKLSKIIDVHSHAIMNIGRQDPHKVRWSVERALSLMDANEIAVTILSVPGAANYAEDKEAVEISRRINEALAEIVAKHPKRFGAMATLPGKTMDESLSEMEYALDTLKLDGLSVPALLTSRSRPCSSSCDGVARANPKHYFCTQSNLSFGEISVQTNLRPRSVEGRLQDRAAASPFLCDRDECNDSEIHIAFQST